MGPEHAVHITSHNHRGSGQLAEVQEGLNRDRQKACSLEENLTHVFQEVRSDKLPLPRADDGNEVMAVLLWNEKTLFDQPAQAFTTVLIPRGGSVDVGGRRVKIRGTITEQAIRV